MISVDGNIVQYGEGVVDEDGEAAVQRDEIGCDGLVIDAHESNGEAWGLLAREARLVEAYDALSAFAGAE
jgi:hypothetical protein